MRSQRRTERCPRARRLPSRTAAALVATLLATGLAACTPTSEQAEPSPTPRVTSVDVIASAEFTAAREAGTAARDDALALLTATDRIVEGTARAALLTAVSDLNTALSGVSAEAITTATTAVIDGELAVADRVAGLGAAAFAAGRGSSARRLALSAALDQLEAARAATAASS